MKLKLPIGEARRGHLEEAASFRELNGYGIWSWRMMELRRRGCEEWGDDRDGERSSEYVTAVNVVIL